MLKQCVDGSYVWEDLIKKLCIYLTLTGQNGIIITLEKIKFTEEETKIL